MMLPLNLNPTCLKNRDTLLQDMNLRELTAKYGRGVGLNVTAVAIYAGQLLVALRHLAACRVLHADIKPDNILVNVRHTIPSVCNAPAQHHAAAPHMPSP